MTDAMAKPLSLDRCVQDVGLRVISPITATSASDSRPVVCAAEMAIYERWISDIEMPATDTQPKE